MHWRTVMLGFLIAPAAWAQTSGDGEFAADEAVLRQHGLPTQGPQLLKALRDRTPTPGTITEFQKQIVGVHASAYLDRLHATRALCKMGPIVRPLVENYLLDPKTDAETAGRLRAVLKEFPAEKDFAIVTATARLLQREKPAGGLAVLLDFVPHATQESVRQEVQRAINVLAKAEKTPELILEGLLKDPSSARRAAAAEAVLRRDGLAAAPRLKAILAEADPLVQYQMGMTLVELGDKTGLPILIRSLANAPAERAEFALEMLQRAAGENAPALMYEGKIKAEVFCAAWQKWYDGHHVKLDLAKQLAVGDLGYTILGTARVGVKSKNRIYEVSKAAGNPVRWEFDGPRSPLDIQILGPNRLLLTEYYERRVTERDFKGNILWQFSVVLPISCQRLANGHTFIASRQRLVIVDREGREQFAYPALTTSIMAAHRNRNGQMAVITSGGRCTLLDSKGVELKSFQLIGVTFPLGASVEFLPNGRLLVPLYNQQSVAEFDWNGTRHWSAQVNRPTSATRLRNGHTLITCSLDYRIVEVDAKGAEIWSYRTDGRPYRARRR